MTDDSRQDRLADLLALVVQARPEQVTTFLLANEPDDVREDAAVVANAIASLALALEPVATDANGRDPLRERMLGTIAGRQRPRAALLVIDMQNDNLTPGSNLEVPRARDIVPAVAARLDRARGAGVPVVYVIDQHEADDPDLDVWTTHNVVGTKGAEVWPSLTPKTGDKQVTKATYSAFTGSKLDAVLDELAVDTLVLTGCVTEVGVLATAMDALQRGYAVEIPPDSQAGTSALAEGVAIATLAMLPPFGPARRDRLARAAARQ